VTTQESGRLNPARQEGKPPFMYASKISEVEVNRFQAAYQQVHYSYDQPETPTTGSTHRRSTGQACRLQMSP